MSMATPNVLDLLLPSYRTGFVYANKLVADVADEHMCGQPVSGRLMNHPAFILGHIAWAFDHAMPLLGHEPALGPAWRELFAMGRSPLPERGKYPSKRTLLEQLGSAHTRLAVALEEAGPAGLLRPAPGPADDVFATVGHIVVSVMVAHFGNHLGQLSAWRRAMGLPRAL